jgi:transposase
MSSNRKTTPVSVIGIDIGKNSFHVVGQDQRGAIVLRQKWSRGQVQTRLANIPLCLIGMEACVGAHHLSRKLHTLGHDTRIMPAKNDFRDAEAIAEAVQRPTMKFIATKTADQLDLQALHRVRERLVSQRTGVTNQIRAFLLERGIAVRQGLRHLRTELPRILARVVLNKLGPKQWERYGLKAWIEAAKKRLHHNMLAIALANKLARIAWAVLNKRGVFECVKTTSQPA